MNSQDSLMYGHQTILDALEPIPPDAWETPGVCGVWSIKDIIAHLASYEHLLGDVLQSIVCQGPTPILDHFALDPDTFNDREVNERRDKAADMVLAEYERAYTRARLLLEQIPVEQRRQNGLLPWYGEEYDLEDFVVYAAYGHKREHAAQIDAFRDRSVIVGPFCVLPVTVRA